MGGRGLSGEVSAVNGDSITVEVTQPDATTSTSSTVVVDDATTYTTTREATADALAVGQCVTAVGESDATGAVSADSMSVSDAVDGECTTGGFGGGFGGGAPGQDGSTS